MVHLSDLTPGDQDRLRTDLRIALIGGAAAALVMSAIVFAVGNLSPWEAQRLLEAALPTTRFLCSGVMTVSATTLALMLTLLSLSSGVDRDIKKGHYERIRQIAFVDVVAFILATLLLVALVIPFGEGAEIPSGWYIGIYYASSLISALLGGILVAVMLLLYAAVRDFITVVSGDEDSPLIDSDEDEEADDQDAGERPDGQETAQRATRETSEG